MSSYPPPPPGYGGPPPPGYGGQPPSGPYGGYQQMKSTNGKAIAALICGICAFLVCPLTAIAAVILAPQAKREIAADPDRYEGGGMAQAGQIIGWIAIGLYVVGGLFFLVLIIIAAGTSSTSDFDSLAALVG